MPFLEILETSLPIIIDVLISILLIVLIYFIIVLIKSTKKITVEFEGLIQSSNELVEDISYKSQTLNYFFDTIDSFSTNVELVQLKLLKLIKRVTKYFLKDKKSNTHKKEEI